MAGARKRHKRSGGMYRVWEGWYFNRFRRRVFFKGFESKKETIEVAHECELRERKARLLGITTETFFDRGAEEVLEQYCAWGDAVGGRGGRPWSYFHAYKRRNQLAFILKALKIRCIGELRGRLADMEVILRRLSAAGRSPRTVFSYGESIKAFCAWCVERSFLDVDPMAKLRPGSRVPVRRRRAFTVEEFARVCLAAPARRRLVYLVAVSTGYRVRELRSLKVRDFRAHTQSLQLPGEFTKNGKAAEQPVPDSVVRELAAACAGRPDDAVLLEVPFHTARMIVVDMAACKVEKVTLEGVLDFHSLRVTYVTWLAELGAHPGEVQELARHSTPNLTFGVYTRSGLERKRGAVNELGRRLRV